MKVVLRAPLSRFRDPVGSHAAAAEQCGSGRRESHAELVLEIVLETPGLTYREIHRNLCGAISEAVEVQRRLNDLARSGYVSRGENRECEVSGRLAQTWNQAPTP